MPGCTLEKLSDALTVAGVESSGISESDGDATAWFDLLPGGTMPLDGHWEQVETADWSERWKQGLRPVTAGRITITPPWLGPDGPVLSPGGPITLVIEPGLAFGTGHHETTIACLQALQELPLEGRHVIDIGTGTGILALAARALGAATVSATDIDPVAVDVARHNIACHGLDGITLAHGSCAEATGPGQVVIANIITDLLLSLAPELISLVAPGGVLLASGVAVSRTEEAVAAFTAAGLRPSARQGREWTLLVADAPR